MKSVNFFCYPVVAADSLNFQVKGDVSFMEVSQLLS